ncbi:MAG: DUF1893 domain-containing protein [Candidatus Bathyarchaeia archaeon]
MVEYIEELERAGKSLMVYSGGKLIFSSDSDGIRPHLEALEELGRKALSGTIMVDKIVGRAAALLILYTDASESYSKVITTSARNLFESQGLDYGYDMEVEHIKTRDGVIYCPFERMIQGISDPTEAYHVISEKMRSI